METSSSPQQVPTNSTSTGNPQEIAPTSLQTPSAGSSLQNASNQTVDDVNQLDQGNTIIPLAAVSETTATITQTTAPKSWVSTKDMLLYGGIGLLLIIFFVGLSYGLFYKKR